MILVLIVVPKQIPLMCSLYYMIQDCSRGERCWVCVTTSKSGVGLKVKS